MGVQFCPLASGSSGNSVFIGTNKTRILVDAGLSGIRIQKGLEKVIQDPQALDGIFITHEHRDHIHGAGILSRRFSIPIYATEGTWKAMSAELGHIPEINRRYVYEDEEILMEDLCIQPFAIPHDAANPVGYNVFSNNCKITIATDMGHISDTVRKNLCDAHILYLEANHDLKMLQKGPYPWYLKKRIMSSHGHLSNDRTGELIVDTITDKLKHIFLAHLSKDNNIPKLAYETVENVLNQSGITLNQTLQMYIANRDDISQTVVV